MKKTIIPNSFESLGYIKCLAPEMLKALAILSDVTIRRSAVDQEDLKPHWKSEKGHNFLENQQSHY